jgi:anti-sigma B factor antagonist
MITESNIRKIEPDISVIDISGRLNLGNTLQALERSVLNLIGTGSRKVIVNLSALDYIDSAGIGMLISCSGQMEQHQGQMRIAGARGAVAKALDMVHMSRIAALDPDLETACRNLNAGTAA